MENSILKINSEYRKTQKQLLKLKKIKSDREDALISEYKKLHSILTVYDFYDMKILYEGRVTQLNKAFNISKHWLPYVDLHDNDFRAIFFKITGNKLRLRYKESYGSYHTSVTICEIPLDLFIEDKLYSFITSIQNHWSEVINDFELKEKEEKRKKLQIELEKLK